jgi:excisionase family DNA binding protein
MTESPLLTIREAAALCRIGTSTLYRLARRRRVGGLVKIGSKVLFHRERLEDWLRRRAQDPIADRRPTPRNGGH